MTGRRVSSLAAGVLLVLSAGLRAEDKYFDSGGVRIRYTDQGQGEPVLLIHGFTANVETQWAYPGILKALAKDYRVIAFDNRGHGKSGKPHDSNKYGREMVEDAVRLLDHLKIQKVHVVGYSMGAMITVKLLAMHPDRLRTATLGGAGAAGREPRGEPFIRKLADSLENGQGIGLLIEALTPEGQPKPDAEQIKLVNKLIMFTNDSKALAAVVRGWKDLMVPDDELKANKVPVLALIGAKDPLKKGVDALGGTLSGLKVIVIPDADHITTFGRPEFVRALRAFLAEHSAAAKSKRTAPVEDRK